MILRVFRRFFVNLGTVARLSFLFQSFLLLFPLCEIRAVAVNVAEALGGKLLSLRRFVRFPNRGMRAKFCAVPPFVTVQISEVEFRGEGMRMLIPGSPAAFRLLHAV